MFSLAPEIARLRDEGVITPEAAAPLIADERRDVVSVYAELRFLTWGGVMLMVTGVGVLVSKHLDAIGPLAIALAISAAAAACYAWATYKRKRAASLVDDYILLLAALLLSADVGFIEHTWHLLGANWKEHLLFLAIVHAATAYAFGSRLVLSVALTSLAGYFGVERNVDAIFGSSTDTGVRALVCAGVVVLCGVIDARLRPASPFTPVFAHFAANLAFWGALILSNDRELRLLACTLTIALAIGSAVYGVKMHQQLFVLYAWVYGLIAINIAINDYVGREIAMLFGIVSSIGAIIGLFVIHHRMKEASA
jgi:predicted membrane protein DUF2157